MIQRWKLLSEQRLWQLVILLGVAQQSSSCSDQQFSGRFWSSGRSSDQNLTSATHCIYCNIQCDGCYGPSAGDCVKCRHFNLSEPEGHWQCVSSCPGRYYNRLCLNTCPGNTYHFDVDKPECLNCDTQCNGGCTGSTAWNCSQCRSYQMTTGQCVARCPDGYVSTNNYTCLEVAANPENSDAEIISRREVIALAAGLGFLAAVVILWVALFVYVRWRRSTGNHDLSPFTDLSRDPNKSDDAMETDTVELSLQQSAFAVNPTQYVDDWLDGEPVTTADWLSGEQMVTLENPLFEHETTSNTYTKEEPLQDNGRVKRQSAFHSSDTAGYCTDTEDANKDNMSSHSSSENEVQVSDDAASQASESLQ